MLILGLANGVTAGLPAAEMDQSVSVEDGRRDVYFA
jgi:hypothetical protein